MLRSFLGRPKTVRVPVNNAQVEVQQVQVTNRPKPLIGRFLATVIITYCVVNTISWVASDDFKKRSQDARSRLDELRKEQDKVRKTKQQSDHWKKQHANMTKPSANGPPNGSTADSEIMHLTIPIWFRKRKPRMYTLKDREWQDAKELMRDEKKLATLKEKTARNVVAHSKHRPIWKHWLGIIQFDGRVSAQFDVAPPLMPPPAYEVPCIFLKSDQFELGWRPLSVASGGRIERTFHPVIFAKAFYAGFKAFTVTSFTITASRLKKILSNPSELRVEVSARNSSPPQPKTLDRDAGSQPTGQQLPPSKAASLEPSKSLDAPKPEDHMFSWMAHQARAQSMTYQEALESSRKVFKQVWATKQILAVQAQTPGLCTIVGSVTFMGKRGKLRFDVIAYYSPSEKAFVGPPIFTGHLMIPDLPVWDAMEKQMKTASQQAQKQPPPNPVPEKQPVEPTPPDDAPRPPPEGKDK